MFEEWGQITEEEILEANIAKYNDDNIVRFYADFEEPKYYYYEYEVILAAVLNVLQPALDRCIRAVDMCGGAGKAAFVLKKCDPGCDVTLVDVSLKMLEIARSRADKQGIDIEIIQNDAFAFLEKEGNYDLIIFSSAIHHFKDPQALLCAAANKLSPEGVIVTIADPTILIKSRRYKFFEFILTNREAKKKTLNRIVAGFFNTDPNLAAGFDYGADIAEYQALKGIDDKKLTDQLSRQGLYPLVHLRYPAGEPFMVKIMPLIGLSWAFSLILRPGSHNMNMEMAASLKRQINEGLPFKANFL